MAAGGKIIIRSAHAHAMLSATVKTFLPLYSRLSSVHEEQYSEHNIAECYLISEFLLCRPVA
jgi:hypothetical protein